MAAAASAQLERARLAYVSCYQPLRPTFRLCQTLIIRRATRDAKSYTSMCSPGPPERNRLFGVSRARRLCRFCDCVERDRSNSTCCSAVNTTCRRVEDAPATFVPIREPSLSQSRILLVETRSRSAYSGIVRVLPSWTFGSLIGLALAAPTVEHSWDNGFHPRINGTPAEVATFCGSM